VNCFGILGFCICFTCVLFTAYFYVCAVPDIGHVPVDSAR
jgi:hypothetical protein